MNVYQLESRYQETHPSGHFFDRDTLKFFGERKSEMRVLSGQVVIVDFQGKSHSCYMLSSLQRKHPLGPRRVYHYFDCETYDVVERG